MDCEKVGKLIQSIRREKGMTQRQLADALNISDKAISKWERGLGCPDVSLLGELSKVLGINIEKLLMGQLDPNGVDGGNMRRIQFFVCPNCGNVITSTSKADVFCCGRKLEPLCAKSADDSHRLTVEKIEDDYYITFDHEMSKAHFISFVAYVSYDRVLLIKLYPEQNAEVRFPQMHEGKLYFYCNQHGLWISNL